MILSGIHAWLGVRIVERGPLLTALALPQIAVLGTTLAFFAGYELGSPAALLWSLVLTLVAAAIFAFTHPPEAIAGIVYAVAAAGAMLVMTQAPAGIEHLDGLLVEGNLLTVSKHAVAEAAALYAAVAAVHWILRKKQHDLILYASLAVVVTSSVAIAGALLVFAYLLVPAVTKRVAVAWMIGAIASAAGIVISFLADLPTEATIVCVLGIVLLLLGAARFLARPSRNS